MRNLVDEAVKATLEQLGLGTADAALAFFQRHPATEFAQAARGGEAGAACPSTTRPTWICRSIVDRGDVWYDPPFDEKGKLEPRRASSSRR